MRRCPILLITIALAVPLGGWAIVDDIPPYAISDLTGVTGKTTIVVHFTAPADQNGGACVLYDVRYSTVPITDCNFTQATQFTQAQPSAPGLEECVEMGGFSCNSTRYVAVKTKDAAGNWSALSNTITVTTKACNYRKEVVCTLGKCSATPFENAANTPAPRSGGAS